MRYQSLIHICNVVSQLLDCLCILLLPLRKCQDHIQLVSGNLEEIQIHPLLQGFRNDTVLPD